MKTQKQKCLKLQNGKQLWKANWSKMTRNFGFFFWRWFQFNLSTNVKPNYAIFSSTWNQILSHLIRFELHERFKSNQLICLISGLGKYQIIWFVDFYSKYNIMNLRNFRAYNEKQQQKILNITVLLCFIHPLPHSMRTFSLSSLHTVSSFIIY